MRQKLEKYWQFMRVGYLTYLAYRFQVLMNVVSYLLIISLNYFLWRAIFAERRVIAGFTMEQMMTYVVIAWSARTFFANRIDRLIGDAVRDGSIAMDLLLLPGLRPGHVHAAVHDTAHHPGGLAHLSGGAALGAAGTLPFPALGVPVVLPARRHQLPDRSPG